MLDILKTFNYSEPNIKIYQDKRSLEFGPSGFYNNFEIIKEKEFYILKVNGNQWMMYDTISHLQASQLFAHYYIASGDVIATGLGLGVRENWLLNNPKIKSLTILEKNENIIEYHKEVNPILFEKANVVNCDAKTYKGKCNTLLLDHYEFESLYDIANDVKNICNNNIECDQVWFWHIETQILADLHQIYEGELCEKFRNGNFKFNIETLKNAKYIYDCIKTNNGLSKLPNLTQEELQLILTMYTQFFQKL
ncbi:hypothetical protein M0Q97_01035 [Candidatus Dojkabacteria bacterium]|jgi:hypothetical protein|nr:hypothetical protein [Candidatus Dojkabacteria bacterium]